MSRLKKATKRLILTARFDWNKDLLLQDRVPSNTGDLLSLATKKKEQDKAAAMTDEEVEARCGVLLDSITKVVFNYVRRGLFSRDTLCIAVQVCLKILLKSGALPENEVSMLVLGKAHPDPGALGPLSEWMPESVWSRVKALEALPTFEKLGDDMMGDSDDWQQYFDEEKPELVKMPGDYKNLSDFHKLLVLRAIRPDRMTGQLSAFVRKNLGNEYVVEPPFNMETTYQETSPATPVFFVLFPGVDPTSWVEAIGSKMGFTEESGKWCNISMGQGQEARAEATLKKYAAEGGWIMLQNVHLMTNWLPKLERTLEICSETAHMDFRCFISAEPPSMAGMKNMPESLMQACIKVANEAPADLQSNLRMSWANFSQDRIDGSSKSKEFAQTLFTICFFHAIVLGRRKFGQMGWSRAYSFNTGDLNICANVCESYIGANVDMPWDDMRYIFGEIMYGGHITDPWDRRTNNTYLQVLLTPRIFEDGAELGAGFPNPQVNSGYNAMKKHIEEKLPSESPALFGLHANAEIGYLTSTQDYLFKSILSFGGIGGGSGSSGGSSSSGTDNVVREALSDILERLPEDFNMIDINDRAKALYKGPQAPYVVVVVQECGRMNTLLRAMRNSLVELQKGLDGALNMSEPMEDLASALAINQVPGRNPFHKASWEKVGLNIFAC